MFTVRIPLDRTRKRVGIYERQHKEMQVVPPQRVISSARLTEQAHRRAGSNNLRVSSNLSINAASSRQLVRGFGCSPENTRRTQKPDDRAKKEKVRVEKSLVNTRHLLNSERGLKRSRPTVAKLSASNFRRLCVYTNTAENR